MIGILTRTEYNDIYYYFCHSEWGCHQLAKNRELLKRNNLDSSQAQNDTPIKNIVFYCLIIYQISFTSYFKVMQITERNIYTNAYLTELAALKPTELQGKFGGFIYGKDFYQDDLFSKVIRHHLPAGYLAVMPQFYTLVNLEVFDIPKSSKPEYNIFETRFQKNSEFYQFVEKQKHQQQFSTITQSQIDFICQNQLGFLIISKNVELPTEIQKLIYREIKDGKSGEKFLILNFE
jgi:cytochrome c-type biogenesis protein CcmH/NrfF